RWHCPVSERLRRRKTKLADVQSLAFSPDGSLIAVAGGEPPEVELWDSHSFERVDVLRPAGPRYITQALFSPDGATLAGVGFDGVVHLWDGRTRRPGAELHHTIYGP